MFGRKIKNSSHFHLSGHWNPVFSIGPYNRGMNGQHFMRQQPFQNYQALGQWNPYYTPYGMNYQQPFTGQYSVQGAQPNYSPNPYPSPGYEANYYGSPAPQNQSIFQNPLESDDYYGSTTKQQQPVPTYPYMNPYPKQSFIPKQPSGVKTIMNSFKAQDGSLDLNKMVDTAGQMMNAVNQVSSMVKGLGGIFKV